jgi:hypothetical protein
MKPKIFVFLFVILLGANYSKAQDFTPSSRGSNAFEKFFSFAWDVTIPTGNKFIDNTSYAGGKFEWRKMTAAENVSIGFDISWNSLHEYKPYQTYQVNANTDVTTDLYKYNYLLPMALTVHKYFPGGSIFVPYVGLGLGAVYSSPSLLFNIYALNYYNWGFLMRPEIGTIIKLDRTADVGVLVAAQYSYSTNQESELHIDKLEAVNLNLGLVWLY